MTKRRFAQPIVLHDGSVANLIEAIALLKELQAKIEGEEWQVPPMKRAVLTGVKMSIKRLEEAAKANGQIR